MSFKRRVYFRVFPTEKLNFDLIKIDTKLNKVYIRHMQELAKNAFVREASYWEFNTNGVFFNATQDKVYAEIKTDLLDNVINGYSGVIIAFGQTGSGKSFTTSGLHFSDEEFGIAPRMAKDLLHLKRTQPSNIKMCVQISYVEFNDSSAVDLLHELPNSLAIYKCRNAKKVKVVNEYDALKCLYTGEGRKNYVAANSEYLSNVCSTVITFHITTKNMDLTNPTKICSRIHVVDLAGSESYADQSALNKTAKEIGMANVTKSQLEQFILRLAQNIPENIRIQQRMNILIYYLDGDFSCENILRFIGHIRARKEDMLVTLSMLRFAHVVQGLRTKKKQIQFDMNEEVELQILRKKLEANDKEKHLNSVLLNIDLVSGLNPPRIAHLNNLIQNYLSDDIGEITVMNVADTRIVLRNMKELYINCQNEVKKLQNDNQVLTTQNKSETSLKHRGSKTSSQGSASKISRKSSKVRSKDSFTKEKSAASTMSEKRLGASDDPTVTELSYASKRKKSRSNTGGISRTNNNQSKKKSSNTSVNRQESKISVRSFTDPTLPIPPDVMPEKKEIWRQYVSHGTYKDNVDEYKQNEKDIKESFIVYVRELKKLQACKENVNKCTNELIVAQTYRRFNTNDEYDEDGFLVISFAEKQCKNHLEEARQAQLIQQEKILKSQEVLKISLENRQTIIKKIDEEFDQYSREHYKIPSVTSQDIEEDLKEITFDINLEHPEESLEEIEEIAVVPGVPDQTLMIRRLQRLMLQEIEKRKRIELEKKHKFRLY